MKVVVGCPVSRRDWILPSWWRHVDTACKNAYLDYEVVMVGDAINDPRTFHCAMDLAKEFEVELTWIGVTDARPTDQRVWNWARYKRMAELRNYLLEEVRKISPDAFLSIDSDILLDFNALVEARDLCSNEAIGMKVYLSEYGLDCPNWAKLGREGTLQRTDANGRFAVDVIMALKLMSPMAYKVDYADDMQGEDTGWSKQARKAGVKLIFDGRVASKHVFAPEYLGQIDQRVGF